MLRRVGMGGDSEVFLAEQLSLDRRKVVLKVYRAEASTARRDSPFARERRLLSIVSADVFPVVYRSGMADARRPYLAMEYVPGRSLGVFLQPGGEAFSMEVALHIVERVCEGLHELHLAHIVHRDVKPDNIILAPRFQGQMRVKMLDFSHARVPFGVEQRGVEEEAAQSGSQYYMAPEQVLQAGTDVRADQYSLSVTVYEMLTSMRAIQPDQIARGVDFFEYMKKGYPVPTRTLGTFRPDLPPQVDAVIARACARDPRDRFGSVGEFQAALRDALGAPAQGEATSQADKPGLLGRILGRRAR